MRIFLSLSACVLLAGCPSPAPVPSETSPEQVATPVPVETPPATPSPTPGPLDPALSFHGAWSTVDDKGELFDIVIFPSGQAVTTWAKGLDGARGERGFWRRDGNRLIVFYTDGWTDILESTGEGFRHSGFSPDTPLSGSPTNQAPITRIEGSPTAFVGIWRLNKEPDGNYLYLCLQSNGRAISTVNGGTEGKWEATDKGAVCTWPDGWMDIIEPTQQGWQKRSWVGAESSMTADMSPAVRAGESRFQVDP